MDPMPGICVAISLIRGVYASSCLITIGTYPSFKTPRRRYNQLRVPTDTKLMTLGGLAM